LSTSDQPNDLWCADYKGEFMLADRRYCYPLTITDFASRYLIACEALQSTKEAYAFAVFENVFREFGLPSGRLAGIASLVSGRFAMIEKGLGFQLVPWQPILEKRIGQHITGLQRDDGGIEWTLGRNRGLSL
jgi:hypothetical protein